MLYLTVFYSPQKFLVIFVSKPLATENKGYSQQFFLTVENLLLFSAANSKPPKFM
jgi:hypothetical protein